jgi:hypothetical protein
MKRLFHTLVSVVVALPLGVGGFCCCLIGHGDEVTAPAAAVAAESHSCCTDSEAPAAPESDDQRCECPARELGVLAQTTPMPALQEHASVSGELLPPPAAAPVLLTVDPAPVLPVAHPPPLPPLERTPSLLRC